MNNFTTSELYTKQIESEKEMVDLGRAKFLEAEAKAEESGRGADTTYARSLTAQIAGEIIEAVERNLSKSRSAYLAPLKELNYNRAVVIALRTMFACVASGHHSKPATRTSTCASIGEALQLELKMQSLCDKAPEYMAEVESNWKAKKASSTRHKNRVVNHLMTEKSLQWTQWDKPTKIGVGGFLMEAICKYSDIFQTTTMAAGRNRKETIIEFTPGAEEWIMKHKEFRSMMRPMYRPMVVPPNEWSAKTKPYLTPAVNSTVSFVRCKGNAGKRFYNEVTPAMYAAVSIAQSTPWRVHQKLHTFIERLTRLKNPLLIPSMYPEEKPPCPIPKDAKPEELKPKEALLFREWKSMVRTLYTEEVARRSNRNRVLMILDIAEEYRNYEQIFFPHSIDSRGRIYSIPTVLQPQGDDMCKALLEFADGERLTDDGVHQLKLQIAAKFGLDKDSHYERCAWFEQQEAKILEVAANPLDHLDWLASADKPFQTLVAIFDYAKWKKNPDAIIHSRVNKDGACNGLQHFSAMLRDGDVGKSVNLTPSDPTETPHSIYKVVADETTQLLKSSTGEYAAMWRQFWETYNSGVVDYKCMKRPVMTLPYSATMYSRMQYIKDYVREKKAHEFFGVSYGHAVKFFADLVTEAMDRRISSARAMLDWLVLACRDIMEHEDSVVWETPMGFMVFNRKNKQVGKRLKIKFEGVEVNYRYRETTEEVDVRSMAAAIAPNFVHSMDACHMLQLVNRCASYNIKNLHLVHDDYGCHVNHGAALAQLAKEEFANMYLNNTPVEDFYNKYIDLISQPPPEHIGTLDLTKVVESWYAFD